MTSFNLPEQMLYLIGSVLFAAVYSASATICLKRRGERGGVAVPMAMNCTTSQCSASSAVNPARGNRFIHPEPSEAWHPELADGNLVSAIGDEPTAPLQSKSIALASSEDSVVRGCGREVPKANFKAGYKALKADDKRKEAASAPNSNDGAKKR